MSVYSVYSPPFDVTSGGIRVMYGLYGWLLAKGQITFLNAKLDDPSTCVGIYPEIVHGNPMGATKVVRYILQTPGLMSMYGVPGPSTMELKQNPSDLVYVFSRVYDTFGVDDDHILFLPVLNLHTFKDENPHKRTQTCYLVGKGINQHKHPSQSIELTRKFATNQKKLAKLLNKCSVLYCYDRLSAMMDIARLCGCRVKYYGDLEPKQLDLYETGMNGLGYGDENVKLASGSFRKHYEGMIDTFQRKLDLFISETQL
jgi:hypothetical protein